VEAVDNTKFSKPKIQNGVQKVILTVTH